MSYNNGYEGECTNPKIEKARLNAIKNYLLYLFISQGVPMLLAGDEFRRTQHGNNNAYCQDNETGWIDWSLEKKNAGLVRYVSNLICLRLNHHVFRNRHFFGEGQGSGSNITWYNEVAKNPDWSKMNRFLGFKISANDGTDDFYLATNKDLYDLTVTLPALGGGKKWYRVVDTSYDSPEDILDTENAELLNEQRRYVLFAGCSVLLMGK